MSNGVKSLSKCKGLCFLGIFITLAGIAIGIGIGVKGLILGIAYAPDQEQVLVGIYSLFGLLFFVLILIIAVIILVICLVKKSKHHCDCD